MKLFYLIHIGATALLFFLSSQVTADTIMFDQAHEQKFYINRDQALDLSEFAQIFKKEAHNVVVNNGPLDAGQLSMVNTLIISGAFSQYSEHEINAIKRFVINGGSLCIMLHVGPLNGRLLKSLGISVSNGAIREKNNLIGGRPTDFASTHLNDHPITNGIRKMNFYGTWALKAENNGLETLMHTSEQAWIDLNRNNNEDTVDPSGRWTIALVGQLGNGKFVVFGDDAIFQNRFLIDENYAVANNLAKWLTKK